MSRARGDGVARGAARGLATILVLGAFVGLSAPIAAGAARNDDPPALVISHRGASADAPEHTFAAYDRAIEQHTDVLECDLQMTADEVLVCMHDTTVDRTTGGTASGRVDSFTLAQLRKMDFGSWFGPEFAGAHIVPFEEQVRCYRKVDPGVQFYAETKSPSEYGGRMEPRLVELLRRLSLIPKGRADVRTSPVIVQSFDVTSLETVKRLAPSLPTAWLWIVPPDPAAAAASTVDVMAPESDYVVAHPEVVAQTHAAGRDLHTWTVDDPAVMDRLLDAGVDGIFSNHTATLRARVDAHVGRRRPRRPVELTHGCPGIAGTVTATPVGTSPESTGPTSTAAAKQAGRDATEQDSAPWILIAIVAVAAIGVIGGLGWWFVRRRA